MMKCQSITANWLLNMQLNPLQFINNSPGAIYLSERCISGYILIFLALWTVFPGIAVAKDVSIDVPDNATANSYGEGWSCNIGYRESKGRCAFVKVPANAYPTNKTYGQGWQCNYGFREMNKTCNLVKVPNNGYLDYSGVRVECNRGYQMVNELCVVITVPVNAYLEKTSYGPGWKCERGYRVENAACVALKVPENAHIGYSGKAWECNKPYIKSQGKCILQ